ncbi:MAG: hypothetical protein A3F84_13385 [Candidatus Handelsmanbacteria bacterium RIFCSPLOWO2_12_FULL_64_10]|uniref:DUF5615 domain-containing protein n=1 Tax=Handelsmanbacteria sp. (strain RIFCSPLOWO2_12_FULL_64_10) TaxID=1817868 RepID=A0A1F6C4L6_HANXR|nr:MAG: hypothetical protein A3F84_13385 [Candidatus Handelsmanbacteria bacterium RIFCSPLOWO2_12_FULL_64_10]
MKGYLLDEHISHLFRVQLLRRQPDLVVWRVGDEGAPPFKTPDPDILRWCEEHEFILVTNNRHTMPVHLSDHLTAGGHVPGILMIDLDAPIGLVIGHLLLIAEASGEDEYRDRIEYVPLR